MDRLGGKGLRIMAAAMKDIDPKDFDPDGDLLSLVQGLQLTAHRRHDRPAPGRVAGRGPIRPGRQHPGADGHRRRRGHRRRHRQAARHPRARPSSAPSWRRCPRPSGSSRIDDIGVVGRVAPEHKVLMVETLRKKGDVVAMTGDGVNDAPAIKAADIGIAMGTGTQVAKNAGRMILTDDNFATIVRAVSEGRKLYDNMLKYIRFMLVALVTYVVTFLMASLLNIAGGQPFSAVQILWINFLITAPVGIALGLDKETPGLMKRKPRPRAASIMTPAVITTVGLVGLFMSVAINAADRVREERVRQRPRSAAPWAWSRSR